MPVRRRAGPHHARPCAPDTGCSACCPPCACSGLLTIGPRFGGAIDDAARFFKQACDAVSPRTHVPGRDRREGLPRGASLARLRKRYGLACLDVAALGTQQT